MFKIGLLELALFIVFLSNAAVPQCFTPPPRKISTGANELLRIHPGRVQVVLQPGAYKSTQFAARELSEMLGKILNAPVPVTTRPVPDKLQIVLGLGPLAEAAGIHGQALCRDGYVIRTHQGKVYIAGRDSKKFDTARVIAKSGVWEQSHDRGTVFGVYDFLERFAGVRFYFPGELGTILPKRSFIGLPSIDIFDRPDRPASDVPGIWFKDAYFEGEDALAFRHPMKKLDMVRHRQQTTVIPFRHGLRYLNYRERFAKSHPEYFALRPTGRAVNASHFCMTSALREEIYQDTAALLKQDVSKRPGLEKGVQWIFRKDFYPFADLMPEDGTVPCNCSKCVRAYGRGGDYAADLMWNFWIDIAGRLKREGVPGYINAAYYPPYRKIPDRMLPDNMLVHASVYGPWGKADKEGMKKQFEIIRRLVKRTPIGRISLTGFCYKRAGYSDLPGIPISAPRAWGEYYEKVFPLLYRACVYTFTERYLHNYLNYYVFFKLSWDAKFDWRKALDEHYALMFGAAAPQMKRIMDELEDTLIQKVVGRVVVTPLGSVTIPPSNRELFEEIYTKDMLKRLSSAFDAAEKSVTGLERRRVQLIRREYLNVLQENALEYFRKSDASQGLRAFISDKPEHALTLTPYRSSAPAAVKTRVFTWLAADALHFRIVCEEPSADMDATVRKFDDEEVWRDNSVEIFIDAGGAKKSFYQLLLNSAGSFADLAVNREGAKSIVNWRWNSGARTRAEVRSGEWIAEFAIPLAALPDLNRRGFGVNIIRHRLLKNDKQSEARYTWSPFIGDAHDIAKFGSMAVGRNLIDNGDFSGDYEKSSWRTKRYAPHVGATTDQKVFFSAPASIRLDSKDGSAHIHCGPLERLKPLTRYRLSFMVRCKNVVPNDQYGGAGAAFFDSNRMYFLPSKLLTGDSDWMRQSMEFTTEASFKHKNRPAFKFYLYRASGTAWIDNVYLEEITK